MTKEPGAVYPRVGVILLRAEWFDSVVAEPGLESAVTADQAAIERVLGEYFELILWIVNSDTAEEQTRQALRSADLDLAVLLFQVWAEDSALVPLLRALSATPLAVWCYQPWSRPPKPASFVEVLRGSGPVGTMEGLGVIRNLGKSFSFTFGAPDDPRVIDDLTRAARAGHIRRMLRRARFGILPYRNDQMQTIFVDEFRLRAELGPSIKYLSVSELKQMAEGLSETEVATYVAGLKEELPVRGVAHETLVTAAGASLGLAHLAVDHELDVISLNDIAPELHDSFGLRPCLYPPLFDQASVLVGLEGDLGAATAMFILNRLADSPTMFVEIWFWDEEDNLVVAGHAGPQNPAVAVRDSLWIGEDREFARTDRTEGAHLQFVARPGRVTLLQLRGTPTGWQAIVVGGEAIETEHWVGGYPHAAIRLDVPVARFLRGMAAAGSTQHWALAYGEVTTDVMALCDLMNIRLEAIR